MIGSQPCKHAWLAGREVVSASVSKRCSSLLSQGVDKPVCPPRPRGGAATSAQAVGSTYTVFSGVARPVLASGYCSHYFTVSTFDAAMSTKQCWCPQGRSAAEP